jgi:MFS family permease
MTTRENAPNVSLGLRANWEQFSLLVLINAFVGGMVGLQSTVVPLLGAQEFKIASATTVLSFIISFGVIKAVANLVSGHFADVYGRKHMLVLGWLIGLPVPFMIAWGPSWGWIVAANILLGVNQGFAWSMTVIMKVDLVGPKSRGLAVGLNEFAGYLAVGITTFLAAFIAQRYGLRPQPFYLGIGYAVLGLGLSALPVRDTRQHVGREISQHHGSSETLVFWEVFRRASFGDRDLFAASQAGLVNNLNFGMTDRSWRRTAGKWAACIGGATQQDNYRQMVAAAGLRLVTVQDNPQYQFISDNAKGASKKFGVKSVSLLAVKP